MFKKYDIFKVIRSYLHRIETGMTDHDVAIDRDSENAEEADRNEAVSQKRKQSTEKRPVQPRTVPERRGREGQIEAAKHQI